jgi:hypothetical protein
LAGSHALLSTTSTYGRQLMQMHARSRVKFSACYKLSEGCASGSVSRPGRQRARTRVAFQPIYASAPDQFVSNEAPMKISKIRVRNFRSIESLDLDLDDTTVFIGANNAGKQKRCA